jgi:hypothetical protein
MPRLLPRLPRVLPSPSKLIVLETSQGHPSCSAISSQPRYKKRKRHNAEKKQIEEGEAAAVVAAAAVAEREMKPIVEESVLEPGPEPELTAEPEPVARQGALPEPDQEHKRKPGSVLEENMPESSSTLCPHRSHHLLEGNDWESCERCRAILREIAVHLARENKTVLL